MRKYTAAELVKITHGTLISGSSTEAIDNVQYDSREVHRGSLFVPIKGANTDPHRYIQECFDKGAKAAFTEYDNEEWTDNTC